MAMNSNNAAQCTMADAAQDKAVGQHVDLVHPKDGQDVLCKLPLRCAATSILVVGEPQGHGVARRRNILCQTSEPGGGGVGEGQLGSAEDG